MKNFYKRSMLIIMFLLAMAFLVLLAMSEAKAATSAFNSPITLQQEITGTVTGPNNQPLLGVTVFRKDSRVGATTNTDGYYSITANAEDTLVFSFIGFKSQEIPVGNRTILDISLEEDIAALGEVQINAGYYNTTKRESTGNISRVTAEEIKNQPVVSPIQALQGRMAGVEVTSGGANPGAASTIRIRGINSLREEGNYPLYIIDGVPVSSIPLETNSIIGSSGIDPLNNINPANIESIEVLKDADATAIYGSRGANGVVLITTKSGSQEGAGLEATIYSGVTTAPTRLDLLTTSQYLQVRRQAFANDEVEPNENNAYDLLLWDQERYTDWQEFTYGGKAKTTNANISFTGGNEYTGFRVGGSYFSQGSIYPGDYSYNKGTGNVSLNHSSRDNKFSLNMSINYGLDVNDLVGNLSLSSIPTLPPNAPSLFNPDGSLNWSDWSEAGLNNPLEGFFNDSETKTNSIISNLALSYEILKGLSLKTSLGYNNYDTKELWKLPARSYNPANLQVNNSYHLNSNRNSWIVEPQLIYENKFGKLGTDFLVGATLQQNIATKQSLQGNGYASESLIGNLASAEQIINAKNTDSEYRYAALFSRIGLNWDRKYYLNLTGRRDGSSRFGPNNRFANFGAIGGAWIFSEEPWIDNELRFLSFGKLRGSFGTTGNDQIGDYGYLDAYEATTGSGGLYPTSLSNPDFSWEVNKKLEAGLELGFFENRVLLSASWYRNRSSNQLVGYPLPYASGFTSVQANLPATVENRGLELELSTINFSKNDFSWNTSFNISFPENELVSYPDIEQSSYANTYRVGYPLNIALYYEYTGLDPETGLYTVRDVNEDGSFDFQDQVVIQDRNREFFGGFNNNISYKGFSMGFLFQFVKQEGNQLLFNAGRPVNIIASVLSNDRYQEYTQSFQGGRAFRNVINSKFPIQDASFLRLKTFSLAYNLSSGVLQKIGLEQFRLFLQGQNLFTITPYDGLDPDQSFSASSIGNLRTITGGIEIKL